MQHAKKMVLISPDMLEKLKRAVPEAPLVNALAPLEQEMSSILSAKGLTDHDRWVQYEQVLQKYLASVGRNNTSTIHTTESGDEAGLMQDDIVRSFGNNSQLTRKARGLLEILKRSPHISWDDVGTVTMHEVTLAGSNIIDLLNDVLRSRQRSAPRGWQAFARILASLNVPREYIVNESRWTYIQNIQNHYIEDAPRTSLKRRAAVEPEGRVRKVNRVLPPPGYATPDLTDDDDSDVASLHTSNFTEDQSDETSDIEFEQYIGPRVAEKRKLFESLWPTSNFDLQSTKRRRRQRRRPPTTAGANSSTKRKLVPENWERDNFDVYPEKRRRRRGNDVPAPQRRAPKRRARSVIQAPDRVGSTKRSKIESSLAEFLNDRRRRKRKAVTNALSNYPVARKKVKWGTVRLS